MNLTDDFICIKCGNEISYKENLERIECLSCNFNYPVLCKNIPILINNIPNYFAESYYLYSKHVQGQNLYLEKIKGFFNQDDLRINLLNNLSHAINFNIGSIKSFIGELKSFVDVDELINVHTSANNDISAYLKDFYYLKRDWCWLSEGEKQVGSILDSLKKVLIHIPDKTNCLFLGAGLGRFAYELSDFFSKVYATDKSFSMAYHYQKLQQSDIYFYEINLKNIFNNSDATRRLKASLNFNGSFENTQSDKISYFVSDALQVPLKDNSLSCIFSIYFTDVIALNLLLPEISRLLKEDGVFIHFGPLDYFFEDVSQMLASNEVKGVFIANGYEVIIDERISTSHLESSLSMTSKTYNNWLFVASKRKIPLNKSCLNITIESIVAIQDNIKYEIKGAISKDGRQELNHIIIFPDGEIYEGAETVIEILNFINHRASIREILKFLSEKYDVLDDESEKSIIGLIETLIDKKALKLESI